MQQLLMTGLLILCLLIIYMTSVGGEQGIKKEQQRAHQQTIDYVRDIDA